MLRGNFHKADISGYGRNNVFLRLDGCLVPHSFLKLAISVRYYRMISVTDFFCAIGLSFATGMTFAAPSETPSQTPPAAFVTASRHMTATARVGPHTVSGGSSRAVIGNDLQHNCCGVLPSDVVHANRAAKMREIDAQLCGLFVTRAAISDV